MAFWLNRPVCGICRSCSGTRPREGQVACQEALRGSAMAACEKRALLHFLLQLTPKNDRSPVRKRSEAAPWLARAGGAGASPRSSTPRFMTAHSFSSRVAIPQPLSQTLIRPARGAPAGVR